MPAALGNLVVSLGLDAAEFVSGLGKADAQAKKFTQGLGSGLGTATAALSAVVGTAALAVAALSRIAEPIAHYKDLAIQIGSTGERVAALQLAADTAGTSIDTVAAASVKLTAALSKTDDESEGVGRALASLGLSLETFRRLDPTEQLRTVAQAMNQFEDGASKTAVAVALYGRAGAELLPFLKDLADDQQRQVKLTNEQIEAADAFGDELAALKSEFTVLVQTVASDLLPVLTELVKGLRDSETAMTLVQAAGAALRTFFETVVVVGANVGFVFQGIGRDIGAMSAQIAALARGDLSGFRAISEAVKDDAARARRELDAFEQRILNPQAAPSTAAGSTATPKRPQLSFRASAPGSKDDPTKQLLDNQLRALEDAAEREKQLASDRVRFLDLYNQQGLVSIRDYYDARETIASSALDAQRASIQAEIALLEQRNRATGTKATERASNEGKIQALQRQSAELEQRAGVESLARSIERQQATEAYARAIADVNAQVLELQGNLAAAAAIRFDQQFEGLRKQFSAEGNAQMLAQLDSLRRHTLAQSAYRESADQSSRVLDSLRVQEDRIATARQTGAVTELGALVRLGEARREAVRQLEAIVLAQEAVAKASENPALALQAQQARAELEKLRAATDPVAEKFTSIFEDAAANAFTDFVTGAKSAKDAFNDFAGSVVQQISRIAAQNLAQAVFGGGGGGGGISNLLGGFIGSLFGGGMTGPVNAAGGFATIAGISGGRAHGGPVQSGNLYRVNERGPELLNVNGEQFLMMGNRSGSVTPNGPVRDSAGGNVSNITVNIPPSTSRASGNQIAADILRKMQQNRRNL